MLLLFITFSLGYEYRTSRGKIIQFTNKLMRKQKVESKSFYYINLLRDSNYSLFDSFNIKIEPCHILSNSILLLYLDSNEINNLLGTGKVLISPLSAYDKQFINNDYGKRLFVLSHNNSIPENKQMYEIIGPNTIQTDNLKESMEYLSSLDQISSISTSKKPKYFNIYATGYSQNNYIDAQITRNLSYFPRQQQIENNITGEGEAITFIDSPIDLYHSFFYDSLEKFRFNEILEDHRKFSYYSFPSGNETEFWELMTEDEHGTHTSGTAAGSVMCKEERISLNEGVAPNSKIVYAGDLDGDFIDNTSNLIDLMSSTNSFISSNSWGEEERSISISYIYGMAAYKSPQNIYIFAAGNSASTYEDWFYFTVCEPGGNKNILTVGALDSLYTNKKCSFLVTNGEVEISLDILSWGYFDELPFVSISFPLKEKSESYSYDEILFIMKEDGKFNDTICNQIDQAIATIVVGDITDVDCKYTNSFNVFHTNDVENFKKYNVGDKIEIMQFPIDVKFNRKPDRVLFSSVGPGTNGIRKPDVMAPGSRIVSASSQPSHTIPNHGCKVCQSPYELVQNDGTSMATPNVAGCAALIRQYYRENYNLVISGTLTRAILINSADRQDGNTTPDMENGHGIINLHNVLPSLENIQTIGFADNVEIESHSHLVTEINMTSYVDNDGNSNETTKSLRITMSYLDISLNIDSIIPIVNDLDLIVKSPSGKYFTGNNLKDNQEEHFSTNEKVLINEANLESGVYEIHIFSNEFMIEGSTQNFSLNVACDYLNSEGQLHFSKTDKCIIDNCTCPDDYTGNFCQSKIMKLEDSSLDVDPFSFSLFSIELPSTNINFSVKRPNSINGSYSSIWISHKKIFTPSQFDSIFQLLEEITFFELDNQQYFKNENTNKDDTIIYFGLFNNHFNNQKYIIEYTYDDTIDSSTLSDDPLETEVSSSTETEVSSSTETEVFSSHDTEVSSSTDTEVFSSTDTEVFSSTDFNVSMSNEDISQSISSDDDTNDETTKNHHNTAIIIGSVIGVAVVILILIAIIWVRKIKKRKYRENSTTNNVIETSLLE